MEAAPDAGAKGADTEGQHPSAEHATVGGREREADLRDGRLPVPPTWAQPGRSVLTAATRYHACLKGEHRESASAR